MRVAFWHRFLLGGLFISSLSSAALALDVGGVKLDETQSVQGTSLQLNGAGVRNKFFVDVYVAGLYLAKPSTSAEAIITSKELQSMRIVITSSQITRERLTDAITEGIQKSAGADFARYAPMLDQLWSALTFEVQKGDVFDFTYVPQQGVHFVRNGQTLRVMPEFEFKKVLFGIWLGEDPIQPSLKEDLLAG